MEFFEKAFAWLADVSSKLPKVDFQIFFIAAAAILFGLGIVFAFTYLGSKSFKLIKASKKIQKYLEGVDTVDDDNVSDFTAHCFSAKAPQALRDSWVQYLGVRFGYPSDIVSDKNVYDEAVKKNKDYRAGIYLCVSLLLLAVFAFWGYGTLDKTSMGTVHFVCLVVIGLMYLFLILINRAQNKHCLEAFDAMQEDLDAKVNLQVEKNYATDSSPLSELAGMVEEIIARNTSKAIDIEEEQDAPQEPTPIEALIEQEEQGAPAEETTATEEEPVAEEEPVEETAAEEVEETPAEDVQEENQDVEEQSIEDVAESEQVEEGSQDEQVEEQSVDEQEQVEENVEDEQEDVQEDVQEESTEENEELTEEPIEEEPQEEVAEEEAVEDIQEPIEDAQDAQDDENVEEIAEQSEEVEENQEETVEEQPIDEDTAEKEQEDDAQTEDAQVVEDTQEIDDASEDAVEEPAVEDEQGEETEEVEQDVEDGSEDTDEEQDAVEEQEDEQVEDESEEEQTEDESEEQEAQEEAEESDPEVVYVVDGDEEDDEVVKPAKLVKLPNLVDYMLSKNMPKAMKLQIASMLIATYKKFENSKEDRKIVVQCLTKVMRDLQK